MPINSDGKLFQNSQERYFATVSKVFFWFLITTGGINGLANLYIWSTDQAEIIPPVARGIAACVGLFNFAIFILMIGAGLIRLRGSTSSLTSHDAGRIIVFLLIMIAPYFVWAIRSDIASSPLAQDSLTGWIAALQLSTLVIGIALASERMIGFESIIRTQFILKHIYDWISLPFSAVRYVRAVLLGAWQTEADNRFSRIDKIDAESLRDARKNIYTDESLVAYFQDTVLTKFAEPAIISSFSQFRTFSKNSSNEISVLDIGGGEGEASARLLAPILAGRNLDTTIVRLDLFENEVLSKRYVKLMDERFGKSVIVNEMGLFDEQSDLKRYNLIILFHSIYSMIDATRSRSTLLDQITSLKLRLEAHLDTDGLIVGSLASTCGKSASFKRKCMMEAFGRTVQDITFEELSEFWKPTKMKMVDTHFKFLGDESGRVARTLGNAWIRYFARLTNDWLNSAQERYLFQHLLVRCTAYEDLSEEAKKYVTSIDPMHEELLDRTQFLHHKTGTFLSVKGG